MNGSFVRKALPADAARIAEIYNDGIKDRTATFETEPRTREQILLWFEQGFPILVAGDYERIMAYAVAFPYRPRACYEGVREFSVYAAREARGKGFGKASLSALIEESARRGWWKLLSRVFPENSASRRLCRSLGFREVGTYEKHARLDGAWRDVLIVEKLLVS
jgi:phosphinothricin acetyltransferase